MQGLSSEEVDEEEEEEEGVGEEDGGWREEARIHSRRFCEQSRYDVEDMNSASQSFVSGDDG